MEKIILTTCNYKGTNCLEFELKQKHPKWTIRFPKAEYIGIRFSKKSIYDDNKVYFAKITNLLSLPRENWTGIPQYKPVEIEWIGWFSLDRFKQLKISLTGTNIGFTTNIYDWLPSYKQLVVFETNFSNDLLPPLSSLSDIDSNFGFSDTQSDSFQSTLPPNPYFICQSESLGIYKAEHPFVAKNIQFGKLVKYKCTIQLEPVLSSKQIISELIKYRIANGLDFLDLI